MYRDIARNVSILAVANAIATVLPLLTFPLITRVLGPEVYGKYGFAMSVAGFALLLASPGFHTYGVRAVAQGLGQEKRLMANLTGIRLLFASVVFFLLAAYTLFLAPPDHTLRTLILLAALPLISNALGLEWLLTGAGRILPLAVAGVIGQLVYTAAVVFLLRSQDMPWVVPVATFAGALAALAISYGYALRRFGLAWPSLSLQDLREIVPPSLLLGFASLMSMTYDKIDSIMLGYFRTMEEVGLYAATYKLMWMVMSFLPILSTVFFPLISRAAVRPSGEFGKEEGAYLRMLFLIALPAMTGGILLADPLTAFVVGREYAGGGTVFAFLLPNVLCGGLATYYAGMRLLALNRNRDYLIAVSAGAALNVGLNLMAIPLLGAVGAAITTCLSQAAVAAAGAWFSRDQPASGIFTMSYAPLVASTCMLVALLAIMSLLPSLHVMLLVGIGVCVYGLAGMATGIWKRI